MTLSARHVLIARLAVPLAAALVTVGCASSATVQVSSTFPTPVVEPLPVRAAVYFPSELRNFSHEETIPQHSTWQFDVGEASVRMLYRLFVYAPDGTPIAEWPVTGYGKSPASGTLPRASLHDATVRAMREAGATISVRFASQPDVRAWLQEKRHEQSSHNRG